MTILALEFSSPRRSVCVVSNGRVASRVEQGACETNAFAMIEAALCEAQVHREGVQSIAVGLGPGSYAGIRIAIAIAQGWHLAAGVSVTGFSSADCVAHQVEGAREFTVALDAQRGEFYGARYQRAEGNVILLEPFRLLTVADWERQKSGELFARPDVLEDGRWWRSVPPDASTLARIASGALRPAVSHPLAPVYLRPATFVKAARPRFVAD